MMPNNVEAYRPEMPEQIYAKRTDRSLQLVLWTLWTLAVVGTALWNWRIDVVAEQPVNLLGMVIYSLLTGLAGMVAITLAEIWFEPERFMS